VVQWMLQVDTYQRRLLFFSNGFTLTVSMSNFMKISDIALQEFIYKKLLRFIIKKYYSSWLLHTILIFFQI
jgi:hypothetical protein